MSKALASGNDVGIALEDVAVFDVDGVPMDGVVRALEGALDCGGI